MKRIEALGGGVLIYLRTGFVGVPLEILNPKAVKISVAVNGLRWRWRQILRDLGLSKIGKSQVAMSTT